MKIRVKDLSTDEILYENIEAEDFLYEQDSDIELEENLNLLEYEEVGMKVLFFGNDTDFEIEKLEDDNIYEDEDF